MGVLPLEFLPGTTRKTLGIDGTETFDVTGSRTPRAQLTLVIHRKDGSQVQVPVLCRLDTAEEVSIYEAGVCCNVLPKTSWNPRPPKESTPMRNQRP